MKRILFLGMILLAMGTTADAAHLKKTGTGDNMRLDPSGFPPNFRAAYDVMKVRCIKCHTMERTIIALETGIAPISNLEFNRSATKSYGVKMMRKPDSNMNMQEIKVVVELLNYLLDVAAK